MIADLEMIFMTFTLNSDTREYAHSYLCVSPASDMRFYSVETKDGYMSSRFVDLFRFIFDELVERPVASVLGWSALTARVVKASHGVGVDIPVGWRSFSTSTFSPSFFTSRNGLF